MKGIIKEFKEFLTGSNVIGLATGVIVGGAVNGVVSSLVDDIFMPLIGILMGGKDFSGLSITIGEANVKYGMFIQNIINFIIIMLVVFFVIKGVNRFLKKEAKKDDPKVTTDDYLKEIRDLLAK